jgi:hypothetical protein
MEIRNQQEQTLYKAVLEQSDAATAKQIVYGEQGGAKEESDSAWVRSSMERLEQSFDEATVKQIRMHCQCGYGMSERVAFLNELKAASSSLEEFAGSERALAAGLFCEQGDLYLKFLFCPCPMLGSVERLPSKTWCQCTTGYSKVLFEQVFGGTFEVELLKSIKAGDDICLMKIRPESGEWGFASKS